MFRKMENFKKEGGSRKKKKKDVDSNRPNRPVSAYMMWFNANRNDIKEKNPEASFSEIAKIGGESWRDLSAEDKAEWDEKAEEAKREYGVAIKEYEKNKPEAGNDEEANINKEGGSRKKKKKDDDSNRTKRPISAYFMWFNANRNDIKEKNPEASFSEIAKIGGESWRDLSAEDKAEWVEKVEEAKREYGEAIKEYEKNKPEAESDEEEESKPSKSKKKKTPENQIPKKAVDSKAGSGLNYKSKDYISSDCSSDSDEPLKKKIKKEKNNGEKKGKKEKKEKSKKKEESEAEKSSCAGEAFPGGYLEKFDPSVMAVANSDEYPLGLKQFAAIARFGAQTKFVKSNFHLQFCSKIEKFLQHELQQKITISGIQGLGKTTSALYIVLNAIKNGIHTVKYINMSIFEKKKDGLEIFDSICSKFGNDHCLIIDHVTLLNMDLVKKVEEMLGSKGLVEMKLLLIETDFTVSADQTHLTFKKNMQLNHEEFVKMWKEAITDKNSGTMFEESNDLETQKLNDLKNKGEEVYRVFAGEFTMTPRLMVEICSSMLILGNTVIGAFCQYDKQQRNEIDNFCKLPDSKMSRFLLHTRMLLHTIAEKGDELFRLQDCERMHVAINIFDYEYCQITKQHIEDDARFEEHCLEEGNTACRLRFLVPRLADYWKEKLPFEFTDTTLFTALDGSDKEILKMLFQSGGPQREMKTQLVKFQKDEKLFFLPLRWEVETNYWKSDSSDCIVKISKWGMNEGFSGEHYYSQIETTNSILTRNIDDIGVKGHLVNIAKCAGWIKEHIQHDKSQGFLLYPQIGNLLGIDYFLYVPQHEEKETEVCSPKKQKKNGVLFCVKGATGVRYGGSTIAKALDVLKKVINLPDILIHMALIVAIPGKKFTLTGKFDFMDISVINLNSKFTKYLKENERLYNLVLQCVNLNSMTMSIKE